jgi:hypothetical protein
VTYARKVDDIQADVVKALRACGVSVQVTSSAGHGFPDLACGLQNRTWLIECKRPGGKLTEDQETWWAAWRGEAYVVQSVGEALRTVNPKAWPATP